MRFSDETMSVKKVGVMLQISSPILCKLHSAQLDHFSIHSLRGWSGSQAACMERHRLNSVKDSCLDGKTLASKDKDKAQESWEYIYKNHFHKEDLYSGFSWPPRSYVCSFCKREFRSAQALGGHMNVHRRDRARLRQSPPWDGQTTNFSPNPSPSLSSFSPSNRVFTFPSMLSSSVTCFSSQSPAYATDEKKTPSVTNSPLDSTCLNDEDLSKTMKVLKGFMQEDECNILKKGKMVMLDLEIGLHRNVTEDLDLELRLGYS
ncbi:hypothetical protein IFM89_023195 [Coptis chinensis]|uniref:C2H2-type domain-containing protein n=1 Tax=Coptis chinensis TaxID=261450 RepID=A0A835LV53_9MAGN|nr:hypothetical protein IFM89_023195 [Coptis chinensis]